MSAYTFDSIATQPTAGKYANYIDPNSWNANVLTINGGGTNFGQPLVRGLEMILLHRKDNSCWVIMTDG